jgi:NAD(P)-dependent dehydrogenase (short-subunit alcohol dehydrogenase family)
VCDDLHADSLILSDTGTAIFVNTIKTADKDDIAAKHPLHGIGTPEDLVGAAVFLASQESRWVTGACLPVDGGFTAQ